MEVVAKKASRRFNAMHLAAGAILFLLAPLDAFPSEPAWHHAGTSGNFYGAAMVEAGSVVYRLGGAVIGFAPCACIPRSSRTVEKFNPTTGHWTACTPMTGWRAHLATAAVAGRIYAIGGEDLGTHQRLATVESYDLQTRTWSACSPLSIARSHMKAAVVDGKIYVIGGGTDSNVITNSVEAYDPATNTWTVMAPMHTSRCAFACAVVNGKIYVMGGTSWSCIETVEEYDPATNTWTSKASMPTARKSLSATTVCGRIYTTGGIDAAGKHVNTVEVYDPAIDTWAPRSGLPHTRAQHSSFTRDDTIYVIGGKGGDNCGFLNVIEAGNVCECYGTLSVSATKHQNPPAPLIGDAIAYQIVVENTGTATIFKLEVVDTIPAIISAVTTMQPTGFSPPSVTAQGPVNIYSWKSDSITAPAGAVFTFTITGTIGPVVCAPVALTNAALVNVEGPCSTKEVLSNTTSLALTPLNITVTKHQSPPDPKVGEPVQYHITITNNSSEAIHDLVIVDTLQSVIGNPMASAPSGYSLSETTTVNGIVYSWASSSPVPPGGTVTVNMSGVVTNPCAALTSIGRAVAYGADMCHPSGIPFYSNPVGFSLHAPGPELTVTQSVNPPVPLTERPITFTFVISNTGSVTITNLTLVDTMPGHVSYTGQDSDPPLTHTTPHPRLHVWTGAMTLGPGASVTVTIDAVTSACYSGRVENTGSAIGKTECGDVTGTASVEFTPIFPAPALVLTQSWLNVTENSPVQLPAPGEQIRYTIMVQNTGSGSAVNVRIIDSLPTDKLTHHTVTAPPGWTIAFMPSTDASITIVQVSKTVVAPGEVATFTIDATLKNTAEAAYDLVNTAIAMGKNICGAPVASDQSIVSLRSIAFGRVKVVGGIRGYINPKRGEHSTILVRTYGAGQIVLRIYDMRGVLRRRIVKMTDGTGMDVLHWDGNDATGEPVSPGIYPILVEGPGVRARDSLAVLR